MAVALNESEKKVLNYIKDYESKGYSDDKIKEALKKSGIDDVTINKCMKIARPLYKKPVFWIVTGLFLLIIAVLIYLFLIPKVGCLSDTDCMRGYECENNECLKSEIVEPNFECIVDSDCDSDEVCQDNFCEKETNGCLGDSDCDAGYNCKDYECVISSDACETNDDCESGYSCKNNVCDKKGAQAQCGDGNCNIGEESCYLDCGCTNNAQCLTYSKNYFCNSRGACESGGSSGSGSSDSTGGVTSCTTGDLGCTCNSDSTCTDPYTCVSGTCVVCVSDEDCSEGYACDETAGTCYDLADCADEIDNDGDNGIDYFGVCTIDSSSYLCDTTLTLGVGSNYCYFSYSGVQTLCSSVNGATFSSDTDCSSASEELESECTIDTDCSNGYACDTTNGDCNTQCADNTDCTNGYACTDSYICEVDSDGDGIPDSEDTTSCVGADCSPYVCEDTDSCYDSCNSGNECASGYDCVDSVCSEVATITDVEVCNDGLDNDNDGYVDFSGGCDTTNDKIVDYICGCQDDNSGLFSNYGDEDIICGSTETYRCYSFSDVDKDADDVTCNVLSGTFYSIDSSCIETDCNDDNDNDLDNYVDCTDSDCDGVDNCEYEKELTCDDNFDNDQDDYVDCLDSDCVGDDVCINFEDCLNGVDDDGDGLVDFDDTEDCSLIDYIISCKDSDSSASDPYLVQGIVSYISTDGSTVTYAEDYCDTTTDLWEYGCFDYDGNSGPGGNKVNCESLYGAGSTCDSGICVVVSVEDCNDQVDNDGDGYIDCLDSDCDKKGICEEVCSEVLPGCADGVDNDKDSYVDIEDSDCGGLWTNDEDGNDENEIELRDCFYKMELGDTFDYETKNFEFLGFKDLIESTSTTPEYYGIFSYDEEEFKLLKNQNKELSSTFSLTLDDIVNDVMTGEQYVNITGTMTECPILYTQNEENCSDLTDNDGDGLTDCDDYDCKDYSACIFKCNDVKDNDQDGGIDYFGACKIKNSLGILIKTFTCQEVFGFEIPKDSDRDSVAESCYMSCNIYYDNLLNDVEYVVYDEQCKNQTYNKEAATSIGSNIGINEYDVSKIEIIFEDPRGILIKEYWHDVNEPEIYDFSNAIIWESIYPNENLAEGRILVEEYISDTATYGGAIDILKDEGYEPFEVAEILAYGGVGVIEATMALDNSYTTDVSKQIIIGYGNSGFNDYGLAVASVVMGKDPSRFSISDDAISFVQSESVLSDIEITMIQYSSELMVNFRLISAGVKTSVKSSPEIEQSLWQRLWSFVVRR